MKTLKTLLILLIILIFTAFRLGEELYPTIELKAKAPKSDIKMADVMGGEIALSEIKKENGLLVIFSCNTCPFVIEWEDRYPSLGELCKKNNIGMAIVNSNEAKREGDDSMDKMKIHAREKNYNSHYLMDSKSEVANAFGAKTTPHVFLFNKDMELVYKGSIDDDSKHPDKVEKHYLNDALNELSQGKSISTSETKAVGCSIKRVSL